MGTRKRKIKRTKARKTKKRRKTKRKKTRILIQNPGQRSRVVSRRTRSRRSLDRGPEIERKTETRRTPSEEKLLHLRSRSPEKDETRIRTVSGESPSLGAGAGDDAETVQNPWAESAVIVVFFAEAPRSAIAE